MLQWFQIALWLIDDYDYRIDNYTRAVFHSNTPPDDDNVDTVNGSEDKEDNVPQGCVLQ